MKSDFNFKRSGEIWSVKTPAKINLVLEIHDKRSDGFHGIFSIVLKIDLYDEIFFQRQLLKNPENSRPFELNCQSETGSPLPGLPQDKRNLVFRAADLLLAEIQKKKNMSGRSEDPKLPLRLFPLSITLQKKIPSEAGLGGGSSDAAAALYALNRIWDLRFTSEKLKEIGARLGSDVPLFFESGLVICQGRGEICRSAGAVPPLDFVLVKPDFGLPTANVYSQWESLRNCQKNFSADANDNIDRDNINLIKTVSQKNIENQIESASLTRQILAGDFHDWFNDLEKPAFALRPDLPDLKKQIEKIAGVQKVQMTGSGTVLFALCANRKAALNCHDLINQKNIGQSFIVRTVD